MAEIINEQVEVVTVVSREFDYAKGLSWYLKDPLFSKTLLHFSLLLISCVFILPIFYVGPLMVGYSIAIIRNIQQGRFELPEIDANIHWKDGVYVVLINFLISLAIGLFFGAFSLLINAGSLFSTESSTTTSSLNLLTESLSSLTSMISSVITSFIGVCITVFYAKTGSLNSIVTFENYKAFWRNNGMTIVIALLLSGVVSSALGGVGFLACCIGIAPAMVVSMYITAGLTGQFNTAEIV